jgi:hypothetical protein
MEKTITYFGQPAKVACDEKCDKAWGGDHRPRIYPQISETRIFTRGITEDDIKDIPDFDEDDYALCSDQELGLAPEDPGTYCGVDMTAKPTIESDKLNRWCVRECERCGMSDPGYYNLPHLPDFSKRRYNKYPHERD